MMPKEKTPKNIDITWLNPFKQSETPLTAKLEDYSVSFDGGTILKPKAEVIKKWSYQTSSGSEYATQKITGPATELFNFMIWHEGSQKDKFIRTWKQEKDKYHKSKKMKFSMAASGEQLSEKTTEHGMTPQKFSEKAGKDYTQIFREFRGERPLGLKQAIDYSKHLDCDPVDLLFDDLHCNVWGNVDLYNVNDVGNDKYFPCQIIPVVDKKTVVPRNIYRANIMAIKVNSPGSWLDRQTAFYYRTDREEETHNGKMVVAKTRDDKLADIGFEIDMYWFGIYNIAKGGKQQILNPDRDAEKQFITSGPFEFIAPVVSLVHPSAMYKDHNYYYLNTLSAAFYKEQEYNERIKELQMQISKLLAEKKYFDKVAEKSLDATSVAKSVDEIAKINEILKNLYLEKEKDYEIPEDVKKLA